MELFRTEQFYIFINREHSLWWDRRTGELTPKTGWDLTSAVDPECLGLCDGIVGKVEHGTVFEPRLMLIKDSAPVGKIRGEHTVFKIKSVVFLPLGPFNVDLNLRKCHKHSKRIDSATSKAPNKIFDLQNNVAFTKTWGTLKSAGNTIKTSTQTAAAIATSQVTGSSKKRDVIERDKFERRILEEFYKIFNDTNSFYYCQTSDLTNSLQRLCELEKKGVDNATNPAMWKTVDDRFFWNRNMLQQLIDMQSPLADPWIMPIIQGYVQIEDCQVEMGYDMQGNETNGGGSKFETFTLAIISRRSRFRAGTRYKRRGVDEDGECANYVETEQIVRYHHHEVSFVQVRGSIPVYWSQPGYKYRPPPRIDKGEAETKVAFQKHFNNELSIYGPVCIVNLVDQTGKEKVIWDAYSNHVFQFNNENITYTTFDFHEYCRGMHFENVSILINSIADIIKDMNYCWRDRQGHICSQTGVFRVNCIDCLDRTNVVQTAIGKTVMEIQFTKLGLIPPDGGMPASIKNTFQLLWANNGDIISKQYAGTNALKGDYTRTGERKIAGIVKDGMNSANRYYTSHFKDIYRQCSLDIMHGNSIDLTEIGEDSDIRTVGNIASQLVPVNPPSYVPQIAFTTEYALLNAFYHMSRYYLSRFKDSTRQGTIDIMLGNYVTADTFNEQKQAQEEEDSAATAIHVKLLIEDCKKMLINNPELSLGSWGLINADPFTGSGPNEIDMDSILILTQDSYYVADYDDEMDRITKYQRVPLTDLVSLECGVADFSSLFHKSSKANNCIRLNYKVDNVLGYFHMFRSTNLRFFNNMAVVIKNADEEIESLKAICEAVLVALEICNLKPIPFIQNQKLDKRKSKEIGTRVNSASMYLDIVGLPQLTRNVSETQLIALKSAGSKALSNVSQHLTRFGQSINPKTRKSRQPKFTVGGVLLPGTGGAQGTPNSKHNQDSSSESEDEYENSIFQPDASSDRHQSFSNTYDSTSSGGVGGGPGASNLPFDEQGIELTEDTKLSDAFLPSVGIVMGSQNAGAETSALVVLPQDQDTTMVNTATKLDNESLACVVQNVSLNTLDNKLMPGGGGNLSASGSTSTSISPTPEIRISSDCFEASDPRQPPTSLKLEKRYSHSTGEFVDPHLIPVAGEFRFDKRSNSDQDIVLNITQSLSESALKQKLTNLTSPVASATKDIVFSPLSKIAKGMQNLGANLDPRKMTIGSPNVVRQVTEREYEEHRQLQEKWRNCKTRLIAL